jgi:serine/threonine protein kinase
MLSNNIDNYVNQPYIKEEEVSHIINNKDLDSIGNYLLVRKLGEGTFGEVYLGFDKKNG